MSIAYPTRFPNKSRNDIHRTTIRDGLFTLIECEIQYTVKHTPALGTIEIGLGDVVNVISVTHVPEWRVHNMPVIGSSQERMLDQDSIRQWVKAANYLMSEEGHKIEDKIIQEIERAVRG